MSVLQSREMRQHLREHLGACFRGAAGAGGELRQTHGRLVSCSPPAVRDCLPCQLRSGARRVRPRRWPVLISASILLLVPSAITSSQNREMHFDIVNADWNATSHSVECRTRLDVAESKEEP